MKFFEIIFEGIIRKYPSSLDRFASNPQELQISVLENLYVYQNTPLPGLGLYPVQYFNAIYAESVSTRRPLCRLYNNPSLGESSQPHFVDSFDEYIDMMKHSNAQVDRLIVAFTAFILRLNLTVFIQPEQEDRRETTSVPFLHYAAIQTSLDTVFNVSIELVGNEFRLLDPCDEPQSVQHEDLSTDPLRELVSMGFSKDKAEKAFSGAGGDIAAAIENLLSLPRITLPDPDVLLFEPEITPRQQHVPPESFEYTQCDSQFELLISTEQFWHACNKKASSKSFPVSTEVPVRFNAVYCDLCRDHLFGSFMLGEKHDVKYRVVSFTMMNRSIVAYHGPIGSLSRKSGKHAFFSQLYPVIHHQDVISVRIARLN